MFKYMCAAYTMTGRRKTNQDNYYVGTYLAELHGDGANVIEGSTSDFAAFAVADGMGGEKYGEHASFVTCKTLSCTDFSNAVTLEDGEDRWNAQILMANDAVCADIQKLGERIGSTVASVVLKDSFAAFTNLGDSRIYLYNDGKLHQLSTDHTEGQMMLRLQIITAEQLAVNPSRNVLTRHIGILPHEIQLDVPTYAYIELRPNHRFLICSDGVHGSLGDDEMNMILRDTIQTAECAKSLVQNAYNAGSLDNMTAVVIDIM